MKAGQASVFSLQTTTQVATVVGPHTGLSTILLVEGKQILVCLVILEKRIVNEKNVSMEAKRYKKYYYPFYSVICIRDKNME